MKKAFLLLSTIALIGCAVLMSIRSFKNSNLMSGVIATDTEVLTDDEEDEIRCRCKLMSQNQTCAANHWGDRCATGVNIHCDEYNGNCN